MDRMTRGMRSLHSVTVIRDLATNQIRSFVCPGALGGPPCRRIVRVYYSFIERHTAGGSYTDCRLGGTYLEGFPQRCGCAV